VKSRTYGVIFVPECSFLQLPVSVPEKPFRSVILANGETAGKRPIWPRKIAAEAPGTQESLACFGLTI
jgi:hypothetical protein